MRNITPLSFYWDDGAPWWLKPPLALIVALGSDGAKPLLRYTVFRQGERDLMVQTPTAVPMAPVGEPSLQA